MEFINSRTSILVTEQMALIFSLPSYIFADLVFRLMIYAPPNLASLPFLFHFWGRSAGMWTENEPIGNNEVVKHRQRMATAEAHWKLKTKWGTRIIRSRKCCKPFSSPSVFRSKIRRKQIQLLETCSSPFLFQTKLSFQRRIVIAFLAPSNGVVEEVEIRFKNSFALLISCD